MSIKSEILNTVKDIKEDIQDIKELPFHITNMIQVLYQKIIILSRSEKTNLIELKKAILSFETPTEQIDTTIPVFQAYAQHYAIKIIQHNHQRQSLQNIKPYKVWNMINQFKKENNIPQTKNNSFYHLLEQQIIKHIKLLNSINRIFNDRNIIRETLKQNEILNYDFYSLAIKMIIKNLNQKELMKFKSLITFPNTPTPDFNNYITQFFNKYDIKINPVHFNKLNQTAHQHCFLHY